MTYSDRYQHGYADGVKDGVAAAAEVGDAMWTDAMVQQRIDAAIERCAQVAEGFETQWINGKRVSSISAAIRALEDKP